MATLYRAETTLQDILGMRVGDELQLAGGGDLPEYTEDDAGKALQVNQAGTGLEWGPGIPSFTSSDAGKVLTVGEDAEHGQTVYLIPEQTVTLTVLETNPETGDLVGAVLADVDAEAIETATPDEQWTLTINGVGYTVSHGNMTTDGGEIAHYNNGYIFQNYDASVGDSFTVSMTKLIPAVAPVWQTNGIDLVVEVTESEYNETTGAYDILAASVTPEYLYHYFRDENNHGKLIKFTDYNNGVDTTLKAGSREAYATDLTTIVEGSVGIVCYELIPSRGPEGYSLKYTIVSGAISVTIS